MGNLTSPKFPQDENPAPDVLHPDGLIMGGLPKPVASLDLLMDPIDLGSAAADIGTMAGGTMPRIGDTPDFAVGSVDMPRYHFYPDRLETDHALLGEPRIQAMLGVIRDREGPAYNVITGGKKFDDFSRHPNIGVGNSHAAGAYQMQPGVWDPIRKALDLPDFSPPSQDLAAVDLLHQKHITDRLLSDDVEGAIVMAARPWASLPSSSETTPNAAGVLRGINRKQKVDTLDQVQADYWSRLR